MVASHDIALLVHTQATISVTIESKTDIQTVLHHKLLQTLNMGRASIVVNVQAVGLIVDDVGICAQSIEHRLSDIPACTVGTVQADLDTLERIDAKRNQIAHVAVAACHIIHSTANVLTVSKGQLRPVLIKDMELAVNVVLD